MLPCHKLAAKIKEVAVSHKNSSEEAITDHFIQSRPLIIYHFHSVCDEMGNELNGN